MACLYLDICKKIHGLFHWLGRIPTIQSGMDWSIDGEYTKKEAAHSKSFIFKDRVENIKTSFCHRLVPIHRVCLGVSGCSLCTNSGHVKGISFKVPEERREHYQVGFPPWG